MRLDEIRIGNYFEFDDGFLCTIVKVNFIRNTEVHLTSLQGEGIVCDYTKLNRIRLETNWLKMFGFEKDEADDYVIRIDNPNWDGVKTELAYIEWSGVFKIGYGVEWVQIPSHINSVDQLQNLVFGLTGFDLVKR